MNTMSNLVRKVERELRLVGGTSVQTYAEDEILQNLQSAFNMIFDIRWWEEYSSWQQATLDGTIGIPNADLTLVKRYEDIQVMYVGGTTRKIPELPSDLNPYLLTGAAGRFRTSYALSDLANGTTRRFQIYPNTAVGDVAFYARNKPDEFTMASTCLLDDDMLVFHAAWYMLETDGTNPGHTALMQQRAADALGTQLDNRRKGPIPISPQDQALGVAEWTPV